MNDAISHKVPDWDIIRSMPPETALKPVTEMLTACERMDGQIEGLTKQNYGMRCAVMRIAWEKKVWEHAFDHEAGQPFRSPSRWIDVTFGEQAARYTKEALETAKLLPDVRLEDLLTMPRNNARVLAKEASSSLQSKPEVIEAAKTLSEDAFRANLTKEHGQHFETPEIIKLTFSRTDAAMFRRALEVVAQTSKRFGGKDLPTLESRCIAWAESYLDEHGI